MVENEEKRRITTALAILKKSLVFFMIV